MPTTTASTLITTLPTMALARPPVLPGRRRRLGEKMGESAVTPCESSDDRMKRQPDQPEQGRGKRQRDENAVGDAAADIKRVGPFDFAPA